MRCALAGLVMVLGVLFAGSMARAHELNEAFVLAPGAAPRYSGPQGREENITEIFATAEHTGGRFGVWRYKAAPKDGPPLHIHQKEDEFFYVLKGQFALQIDDCIEIAPAGSFAYIPKDAVHTFKNMSDEPGELLGVVSPGGFEGFFAELPGADVAAVQELSKKHWMEMVGSPIDLATLDSRLSGRRSAHSVASAAQPGAHTHRIGVLAPGCDPSSSTMTLMLEHLRTLGYIEGENLEIEWRFSKGRAESFPALAAELVGLGVDLILTISTPAALAAQQATRTIPIVMAYVADPVGTGLVASLAQPGGNITGISDMATDLSAKRLELLKRALPTLSRVAVIWNAADPGMVLRFREIKRAAEVMGLQLQPLEVRSPRDFPVVFAALTEQRPDALFVIAEVLTITHRCHVLNFATESRLPAMYEFGLFAREGGLIAYGPKLKDSFRRVAYYVDKILADVTGPATLPVEQPQSLELVINLETAKELGLTIPSQMLYQADHVSQYREKRCARIW